MGREIVLAVDIETAAGRVFDALSTRDGLAGFWTPDVSGSGAVGEVLAFGFDAAPADLRMTVTARDEGRRVAWSCAGPWPGWEATELAWSLEPAPDGGGTRAVLVHRGWADDHPDGELGSVAFTWAQVLGALKAFVESGTPQPALR